MRGRRRRPAARARRGTGARAWQLLAGAGLLWGLLPGWLMAHGSDIVLSRAQAGPFILYAWIAPWPAETGEVHVTVSVNEPARDTPQQENPVLNAQVTVQAAPAQAAGPAVQAPATHANAVNKLFYEARFVLPTPGEWTLTLQVQSDAGAAELALPLTVIGEELRAPAGWWGRLMAWTRSLFAGT